LRDPVRLAAQARINGRRGGPPARAKKTRQKLRRISPFRRQK